jgi:hypothetical protein
MRTLGAITRCICSVVAIRYCVSTPSAIRSPLPMSTPIITDLLASRPVRHRPARPCAYRSQQQPAPIRAPTTKARPQSRSDNASVDEAQIPSDNPADNRPHPLPRLPAKPQVTTPSRPWPGGRHPRCDPP